MKRWIIHLYYNTSSHLSNCTSQDLNSKPLAHIKLHAPINSTLKIKLIRRAILVICFVVELGEGRRFLCGLSVVVFTRNFNYFIRRKVLCTPLRKRFSAIRAFLTESAQFSAASINRFEPNRL